MTRDALDELKRQIPVWDYLQAHDWRPLRQLSRGGWMGLCPLHPDHHPSFVVDPGKGLFYCYGCGRGGDVIRFAEIYHEVRFPQAVALLRQWRGLAPLLQDAANFYRLQLHRHAVAVEYLDQRGIHSPEVIDHMRIGYAPGACLRRWLMELGHPLTALSQAGLVTSAGYDEYVHRIVLPLEGNLYGRSISASAPPHRFLPASKGGLYRWEEVRCCREVILVEGLFDYAVLWQAGFHIVGEASVRELKTRIAGAIAANMSDSTTRMSSATSNRSGSSRTTPSSATAHGSLSASLITSRSGASPTSQRSYPPVSKLRI